MAIPMHYITIPLNALMALCYDWTGSYLLAIVVFTLLTKVILFPVSCWTHRDSIKMVEMMPELNALKVKYYGDKATIAEETQALYKRMHYSTIASTIPMIIQLVLLAGVIAAVKNMLGGDTTSVYAQIPSQLGGVSLLMPVAAGLAALALGLAQNRISPLQREQSRREQFVTNAISVAISLSLGAFVSIGTCVYWIASNLFSILNQLVLNTVIKPAKYIDYAALADSRTKLAGIDALSNEVSKEDKKREKADYKRFFSVANKHLVFYSEKSGFYKYFKNVIEYLLAHSNVIIHYVTSDPKDQIFKIAETQPRIRPYYIGEKKLITLFMKMDADMVVMTTPDLDNLYLKRSYVRKDIEYVYMFHGAGSTNMVVRKGAYDHFDTILCVGQHQIDELRETEKMYNLPPKNLVPCGYGLFDDLIASYVASGGTENEVPRILIAPSWQEDNIIESCIDTLLEQLLCRNCSVTVRPHPEYVKRFPTRVQELVERYAFANKEKLTIETDFSSNVTIFTADLIITDWSGIGIEYSYCTKKPALFINTPMKVLNPDYDKYSRLPMDIYSREEIGVSLDLNDLSRFGAEVDELLSQPYRYRERIESLMAHCLFNVGKSGEAGGRYIIERLMKK